MFAFLFGYSVYAFNGDIVSYADSYEEVCKYDYADYWYLLVHTYSSDRLADYNANTVTTQADIYALTLQFLLSRVTDNPRWFWGIVSVIYTYLVLKFILEAASLLEGKSSKIQKIFFAALLLTVPFYVGVTGIRFWTALFLFMIYAIKFIKKGDIVYFFIAFSSVFIHYTFLVPVILLLIYRFVRLSRLLTYTLILVSVAFFSLTTATTSLNFIKNLTSNFDETRIDSITDNYTNVDIYSDVVDQNDVANWYVKLDGVGFLYFLIGIFLLEYSGLFKWKKNEFIERLEPFHVIIFCISLITFNLGSIGRFCYIFYLVSLLRLAILAGLNPHNRILKTLGYITLPLLIIHVLLSCRAGFYFVDPLLLVGNPVILIFMQSSISLSELIVGH
ncbi:MAG: EpsG family protein [Bacteroidetes bacterium]|nr:EpsG family protein [Bacteroidota bacterium]